MSVFGAILEVGGKIIIKIPYLPMLNTLTYHHILGRTRGRGIKKKEGRERSKMKN